jgi:hypothetical protein
MAGAGSTSQHFRFEAIAAHERHDDGLVHNHNWAATTDFPAMTILRDAALTRGLTGLTQEDRFFDRTAVQAHDHYDEGLVHNHDWAVSAK